MEYNGEEVADTSFCIKFLNKTFKVDLNAQFSAEQRGIAHAWQKMIEENTYWYIVDFKDDICIAYQANVCLLWIHLKKRRNFVE